MKNNKIKTCMYLVGAALVVTAGACALNAPQKNFYKGIRLMDFRTSVISSAQARGNTPPNPAKANIDINKIINENRNRINAAAEKFSPENKTERKTKPTPSDTLNQQNKPENFSAKTIKNSQVRKPETRKSHAPKIKIIK